MTRAEAPEGQNTGRYRTLRGPLHVLVQILKVGLPVYGVLYVLQVFTVLDVFIYSGTHNAIFLAVILTLVFLLVPASNKAPRDRVPWYDWLLIVISLAGCLYLAVNYERILMYGGADITVVEVILGLATVGVLVEAARRTTGWAMVLVALFFLVHGKFAYLFPGPLHAHEFSWQRLTNYIYLSDQGVFGSVLGIAATTIMVFVLFGGFLSATGGAKFFLDFALALMGHVRGGAAKVAIVGSALLGTITGSPVANVGIMGSITIPLMKSIGYRPEFAGAVEAVASTGGSVMPPVMGAVAFIMADLGGFGYAKVVLVAIIPAILYYLALYFQVDFEAAKYHLVGLPRKELPSLSHTLRQGWLNLVPLVVLVVLLVGLKYEPIRAVIYSLAVLIGLSMIKKETRLTWSRLLEALESTSIGLLDVGALTALAGVIIGSITLTGLGLNISRILIELSGGSLVMLTIITAVACYILGMGVSSVVSYILLATLVAPAMVQSGVPAIVAHFFIFYMGLSTFITPPYAIAAFVASGIAGASAWKVGFNAMRLGIVTYLVPVITIFNPALLLVGTPGEIVLATTTALVSVVFLAAGIEGYLFRRANIFQRIMFIAGGLLLFIPGAATDIPGLVILALSLLWHWRLRDDDSPGALPKTDSV